jgi:hypothetical protein
MMLGARLTQLAPHLTNPPRTPQMGEDCEHRTHEQGQGFLLGAPSIQPAVAALAPFGPKTHSTHH